MPLPAPKKGTPEDSESAVLSSADLEAFIHEHGLEAEIVRLKTETPTVESAAAALGVSPDVIIKSLIFDAGGLPVVVVAGGLRPVLRGRLAAHLGIEPSAVSLASPGLVSQVTGYPVGAVPPFGHLSPLTTLMDPTLTAHEWIYGGGGDVHALLRIRPATVLDVTRAELIDLQSSEV